MSFPRFVYKTPGPRKYLGKTYQYVSVADEIELEERLSRGWFETREEAFMGVHAVKIEEIEEDDGPATRVEMEQIAKELGVKFDGRTSDKKLNTLIEEALRGLD